MADTFTDTDTDAEGLYCPACGYDLRRTESGRCPECGGKFDPATLVVSRIAWAHRRALGRVRAWWRTFVMVAWRPGELGLEVARPVGWLDAKRFSWVAIGLAAVLVGAAMAGLYPWLDVAKTFRADIHFEGAAAVPRVFWFYPLVALWNGPGLIAVVVLGTAAGMAAATWWVRVWFWGAARTGRDRASAIACYGGAWWPIVAVVAAANVGVAAGAVQGDFALRAGDFPWLIVLVEVLAGIAILIQILRLFKGATRCGGFAIIAAALGIPAGEAVLFLVSFAAVDYVLGLGAMAIRSLVG